MLGAAIARGWGSLTGRATPRASSTTCFPAIGHLRLDEMRPRHLVEMVRTLRGASASRPRLKAHDDLAQSRGRCAEGSPRAPHAQPQEEGLVDRHVHDLPV